MKNKILLFLFCLSFLGTANAQSPPESELSTATAPYFLKIHCQDEKKFEWIWFRPHLGHAGYWDRNEGKDKPFTRWLPTGNPNHLALDFGDQRIDFKIKSPEKVTLNITEQDGSITTTRTCNIVQNDSPWEYFRKMEGVEFTVTPHVNEKGFQLLISIFDKYPSIVYDLEMLLQRTGRNLVVDITNESRVKRRDRVFFFADDFYLALDAYHSSYGNEDDDRPPFLESMVYRMIQSLVALGKVDNVKYVVEIKGNVLPNIQNFYEFIDMLPAIADVPNNSSKSELRLTSRNKIGAGIVDVDMTNPKSLKDYLYGKGIFAGLK